MQSTIGFSSGSAESCELLNQYAVKPGDSEMPDGDDCVAIPPMPEKERPGRMLKGLRLRERMTQKQVASVLDVSQRHISDYERGRRPIPAEKAARLAELLHTVKENFLYNV